MGIKDFNADSVKKEIKTIIDKKCLFLNLINEDDFEKAAVMLLNWLSVDVSFNANITVSADNYEISNQYGEVLLGIVEKNFPNSCGQIDEKDLYDHRIWNYRFKKYKIVMVKNCLSEDPEKIYTSLSEIEKTGWKPAVILCTNYEGLERMKAYDYQDYRLYHYLCGYKICISDIGRDNILDMTVESLERNGYILKKDFRYKLGGYIQAVYPEARLTEKEFVDDLIFRIYQVHYQKVINGMEMDASDVPYSKKAEKLMSESDEDIPKKETKTEDIQWKKEERTASKNNNDQQKSEYSISTVEPVKTHFTDLENSGNVLILSMSTLPPSRGKNNYCVIEDDGCDGIVYRTFTGVSQLEPGTKFFISKLADQKLKPDKIIVLTTNETKKQNEGYGNKSAVDIYCENIVKYIVEGENVDPALDKFLTKEIKDIKKKNAKKMGNNIGKVYPVTQEIINEEGDRPIEILRRLIDIETIDLNDRSLQKIMTALNTLSKDQPVNLFIDLQGGSRTFMFTMFAAMTMLRDRNVTIKELFATKFDSHYKIHPIEIVSSEYAIIDLVAGIRAFTRYGKVEELKNFIEKRELTGEVKENEKKLLEIMEKIDGHMQINDPEGFTKELNKLSNNDAELLNDETYNDSQFKLIVEDLADAYRPILESSSILDQIKWFAERDFIPSALTFIEDKIPSYMLQNDFIAVPDLMEMDNREIIELYDGYSYQKKENNIFNFVFPKLINDTEENFYKDLCVFWATKLKNIKGLKQEEVSNTLYTAIFEITDSLKLTTVNLELFEKNMGRILDSNILGNANVSVKGGKLRVSIKGKNISLSEFAYQLWKKLISNTADIKELLLDKKIDADLRQKVDETKHLTELDKLWVKIKEVEKATLLDLVKFAEEYFACRNAKDCSKKERKEYSKNSYRNLRVYVGITEYHHLFSKHFHVDGQNFLHDTIAGIRDDINVLTTENQGIEIEICVNRTLLNFCIRFYQALKKERNATNHAEESTIKHMDYHYTKKAIFVFVELCKRLAKTYSA